MEEQEQNNPNLKQPTYLEPEKKPLKKWIFIIGIAVVLAAAVLIYLLAFRGEKIQLSPADTIFSACSDAECMDFGISFEQGIEKVYIEAVNPLGSILTGTIKLPDGSVQTLNFVNNRAEILIPSGQTGIYLAELTASKLGFPAYSETLIFQISLPLLDVSFDVCSDAMCRYYNQLVESSPVYAKAFDLTDETLTGILHLPDGATQAIAFTGDYAELNLPAGNYEAELKAEKSGFETYETLISFAVYGVSSNSNFESISFALCGDSACSDIRNFFDLSDTIHITSFETEDAVLTGRVILPDGSAQNLDFISNTAGFRAYSLGTHKIEITASKEGYYNHNADFEFEVVQEIPDAIDWGLCGNGVIDAGEDCDPGIAVSDACTSECKTKERKTCRADANSDTRITILDLIFVRNKLNQDASLNENKKADANSDGRINILDLIFIKNRISLRNCDYLPTWRQILDKYENNEINLQETLTQLKEYRLEEQAA